MKCVKLPLNMNFSTPDDTDVMRDEKGNIFNLGQVLRMAIASEQPGDAEGSHAEVISRRLHAFDLLTEIKHCKFDLFSCSEEQAAYLKGRVARMFSPVISGPLIKLLSISVDVPAPPQIEHTEG